MSGLTTNEIAAFVALAFLLALILVFSSPLKVAIECLPMPASLASKALCQSARARLIARGARLIGLRRRTRLVRR